MHCMQVKQYWIYAKKKDGNNTMSEELFKYAKEMIDRKKFDKFTSEKIMDYLETHDKLYGEFIPTKNVIDRIEQNLEHNIEFRKSFIGTRGGASTFEKKIIICVDDFGDDEFFHEIDHIATTKEIQKFTLKDFNGLSFEEIEKALSDLEYHNIVGINEMKKEKSQEAKKFANIENEGITYMKQKDYAKLKRNECI